MRRGIATKIGRLVILSLYHSYAKKSFWGNRFFQKNVKIPCEDSTVGFCLMDVLNLKGVLKFLLLYFAPDFLSV